MQQVRASPSVCAKLCKMEKVTNFTHFKQKNTHISECKVVHKCTIATVIVYICTVIVACAFNILTIFSLSWSLLLSLSPYSPSHLTLCDQHQTTATRRTRQINIKPVTENDDDWKNKILRQFGSTSSLVLDSDVDAQISILQRPCHNVFASHLAVTSSHPRMVQFRIQEQWCVEKSSGWLGDDLGFGLGWFDLEWFANRVVMMMVAGSKREREAMKKISEENNK